MPSPKFLPWSIPAAACLALGIMAADMGAPFWLPVFGCALGLLLGVLLRVPISLLVTLVLLPVGYLRYDAWNARENPLTPLFGETLTLSGVSDGEVLTLDEPQGVRVVLTPRGSAPAGRVTLRGELGLSSGKRNPGGFDYRAYLRRRGVWGQLFVDEVLEHESAPPGIRARLREAVAAGLPEREAALALAIHLGVRDDLGELRDLFSASGLAHLLALSGLNVAILVTALGFALRPLGLWRYPALMAIVVGFLLVVEPSPSVFRAGVMALVVLLSLWLGGGRLEVWPTLGLSALGLLLWNPSWLFDISFQLSYLAVAGLLVFVRPLTERVLGKTRLPEWHWKKLALEGFIVSLAAQAATLPLIASSFGSLPLLSAFVNVLAVPIATVLVPLGFVVALLGLVSLPLAAILKSWPSSFTSCSSGLPPGARVCPTSSGRDNLARLRALLPRAARFGLGRLEAAPALAGASGGAGGGALLVRRPAAQPRARTHRFRRGPGRQHPHPLAGTPGNPRGRRRHAFQRF